MRTFCAAMKKEDEIEELCGVGTHPALETE
jgi:hypothetical protein